MKSVRMLTRSSLIDPHGMENTGALLKNTDVTCRIRNVRHYYTFHTFVISRRSALRHPNLRHEMLCRREDTRCLDRAWFLTTTGFEADRMVPDDNRFWGWRQQVSRLMVRSGQVELERVSFVATMLFSRGGAPPPPPATHHPPFRQKFIFYI